MKDELNNEFDNQDDLFNNFSVNDHTFKDGDFTPIEEDDNHYQEPIRSKKEESNMKEKKEQNGVKQFKNNLPKDFLKIAGLVVSGVLLALSLVTGAKSFVPAQKTESQILAYNVTNSADYKVNLVENNFYETTTLGKGELVPVTFIKDIEVDFSSYLSANKQIDMNYSYRITGAITATASDNGKENSGGKIWTKNYVFVEPKNMTEVSTTGYNVQEKVVVDYKIYNDLVNQYKLKAGIPMDAALTITLTVDANSDVEGTALKEASSVSVKIPLSVATVLITTSDDGTNSKNLVNTQEIAASKNYVLLGISIVIFLGSLAATIYLLKGLRKMTEEHSLLIKFNKIMRDYNQVIIEIEELPEVKNVAVIEVKTFKDMLDVQKELHLPIMCERAKDEDLTHNVFYIVNQNQIFKYRMNGEQERL